MRRVVRRLEAEPVQSIEYGWVAGRIQYPAAGCMIVAKRCGRIRFADARRCEHRAD
ncbi:hypothetical protein D3C84_1164360 [compost metagenome]